MRLFGVLAVDLANNNNNNNNNNKADERSTVVLSRVKMRGAEDSNSRENEYQG